MHARPGTPAGITRSRPEDATVEATPRVRQVEAVGLDRPEPHRRASIRRDLREGSLLRLARLVLVLSNVECPLIQLFAQLEAGEVLAEPRHPQDPQVSFAVGAPAVRHGQLAAALAALGAGEVGVVLLHGFGYCAVKLRDVGGGGQGDCGVVTQLEDEVGEILQVAAVRVELLHVLRERGDHVAGCSQERRAAVDERFATTCAGTELRPLALSAEQSRLRQQCAPRVVVAQHGDTLEEVRLLNRPRVVPDDDAVGAAVGADADGEDGHFPGVEHGQAVPQLDADLDHLLRIHHRLRRRPDCLVIVGGEVLDPEVSLVPDPEQGGLRGPDADDGLKGCVLQDGHLCIDDFPEHLPRRRVRADGDLLKGLVAESSAAAVVLLRHEGAALEGVAHGVAVVSGDTASTAFRAKDHELEGARVDEA
mmetsp:Transcript_62114/g.166235  ORF Transcript_62114/g.166235 Transcript_62114/m.166235 type:complete len:421 (+) Transcript_62114:3-1265(+)